ncbi:hypothetical protein Swit_5052 (plasmid) [Rhizorhabdus wittichii RW1]|uniref:EthD domain-containing protein n=1 Tax=Rhizorhabdus wittichii (strain DSM 6014 / CCUG 31198 / JCM 15750 / NBRC 105917 / EY 4224 / RW1) TaxID=392499 RepID=A0A9J9HH83_RHIWR|nr:EthD domain-containing protein [Sphingobium sp. LB126]ABQ71665.1 hypothetical protein Swit_5052 [Rhizorhabdus wittichii RW1]PJG45541.1 hypothetical protein CAF53_22675 [Sphingobium sp. LB126]
MLKAMIASCRRPTLSRPEFFHYMANVHAPMATSLPAIAANILHATQNRTMLPEDNVDIATLYRHDKTRDSVVELCFDNLTRMMNIMEDEGYLSTIRPDEENFNDLTRALLVFLDEEEQFSSTSEELTHKTFDYVRRRRDMTPEEFQVQWADYGRSLASNDAYRALAKKRIHNIPTEGHPTAIMPPQDFDGVAATFFDSFADADALVRQGLADGEKKLVDIGECLSIVVVGGRIRM